MFTTAYGCILHNQFDCGKVNYLEQLQLGIHDPLVPKEFLQTVKSVLECNPGRSNTASRLLSGFIRCTQCLLYM